MIRQRVGWALPTNRKSLNDRGGQCPPYFRAACGLALVVFFVTSTAHAAPWKRHTIDNTSRGADGVRLADVNGDGHLDIATGWEEGGIIRVYLNPGPRNVKKAWPSVTVGRVKSAEDAVFVDLDNDGAVDVVSSCEGRTRTMYVHWAPKDKAKYLDETAWKTEPIPATAGKQMWMFCVPQQVDGRHGVDLIVGSKGGDGAIGWLEAPANPRDLSAWSYHKLRDAGWIMSMIAHDVDGDGDNDLIFSDRKGAQRGIYWLASPGAKGVVAGQPWKQHTIGATDREVMFLSVDRFEGYWFVHAAIKRNDALWYVGKGDDWEQVGGDYPADRFGTAKAVRAADMNGDGRRDLVISCEGASGEKSGLFLCTLFPKETYTDIAGSKGVKYDLIELVDLDGDGDLDVITCEERDNLGVVWYENPTR